MSGIRSSFAIGSFAAQTYVLNGPGITSVTFSGNDGGFAGFANEPIDTLVLTSATPLPAALSLFAGGLGFMGLLAQRKKQKAALAAA